MECTQRLFTTQDQNNACGQQIGYLAVNGIIYPIKIGHNKIGRNPQMCNLVLNMDTVSREHALINILNEKVYTLMDMGSANKTILQNYPGSDNEFMSDTLQVLDPYIPYLLKKGATIQFGLVQAVFKLLEDDSDLPATQVLDIPATPENFAKPKSWHIAAVMIPESPDKDDSFVIPSQPHKKLPLNKNLHFVKPSNKMVSIQPVGSNKIDNVYWNSSKKSKSFSPSCSLNMSDLATPESKKYDIYEMETQDLFGERNDEIYSAETQIPHRNAAIINNISKLPPPDYDTNIHEMETQAPNPRDDKPTLSVHSHDAESAIHSLDTQIILPKKLDMNNQQEMQLDLNLSDKENSDSIYNAETQSFTHKEPSLAESGSNDDSKLSKVNKKSRMTVNTSDDDLTDCEDVDLLLTQPFLYKKDDNDLTNTENIVKLETASKANYIVTGNIEDQATQILDCNTTVNTNNEVPFEDMLTQVLIEDSPKLTKDTSVDINQCLEKLMSPFKIPLQSNSRLKKKDTSKIKEITLREDQHYKLTQDIYDDLCSQKQQSPKTFSDTEKTKDEVLNQNNEILPYTRKHYVDDKSNPHIEAQLLSPKSMNSSSEDGVNAFVSNLSRQEVCDMIGVKVAPLQKIPSDGSDVDVTPKKSKPFAFSDSEMPSSQDIKASVSSLVQSKTETSSESESECSDDQNTPVLFRPKKKPTIDAKKDLTKSFDIHTLPTRVMVRNRKEICDDDVDTQIIQENIIRLKNKSEKKKDHKESTKDTKSTKSKKDNDDKNNKSTKKENKDISNKKDKKSKINIRQLNENTSKSAGNDVNKTKSKIETECDTHHSKKEPRKTEVKCNTNAVLAADNDVTVSKNKGATKPEGGTRYSKYKKSVHKNKATSNSDVASTSKNTDTLSKQKSENKSPADTQYSKHKKPDNKLEVNSNSDATSESKSSVPRRTRSTRQQKLEAEQTSKSISPERNTSRRSQRKKIDTKRYSPTTDRETEVRRSKRQRTIKEYQPVKEIKSILKNQSDQSTVYNVSSELNSDCSKTLKRSVETDVEGPSSKRSRGVHANNSLTRSAPVRGIKTHYVLFTAFPSEPVRHKLETLGAKVVSDVKECTVVITIQLRRTFKLLCAVGLGKPIVGPNWVQACVDTNMIVDPWLYLMQDAEYEKKFQFSLARTLKGNRNFLKGYNISSTPSVVPPPNEMKLIVECSGGTWQEGGAKWVCVSCKADMHLWPAIRKRGATIVTAEFVLGGAIRQRLDIAGNAFK